MTATHGEDRSQLPYELHRGRPGRQAVYGPPSALNRLHILNAEPHPGRGAILLLREAIGY